MGSNHVVLGGHDVAGVGDIHQLFHAHRVEGEGKGHFARVDTAFEFFEAAYTAYEINAFVAAKVGDANDVAQYEVRRNRYVEHADRIAVVVGAGACGERVPVAFEI